MKLSLPTSVFTPDQVQFCAEELHAYSVTLGKRRRQGKEALAETGLSPESQELVDMLPAGSRVSETAVEELRGALEDALQRWPKLELTLAGPAPRSLRKELVAWLRANIRPNLLVEFKVNPDIAGGLLIRTTNRVYDCSFRGQLLADTTRFTRILENV